MELASDRLPSPTGAAASTSSFPAAAPRAGRPPSPASAASRPASPDSLLEHAAPDSAAPATAPVPPPRWTRRLPAAVQRGVAQSLHAVRAADARAGVYLQRPEVQRTWGDVTRAAGGTAFALALAGAMGMTGATGALTGVFIGQSGVEGLASSLPWVGSMLGSLIGKGDIYGVAATAFVVESLRRCLMRPQDNAGDGGRAAWWAFHVATALSLAPLVAPGAVVGGWAAAGALAGASVCSLAATRALREPGRASVETIFCVCMLAWGLAPMPAHLVQVGNGHRALGAALSVPSLAVMLVVVKNLGLSLVQRFNLWGNAGPQVERLQRQAFFEGTPEARTLGPNVHVVPSLTPRALYDDAVVSLRMANQNGNDHGTQVFWLSGRAHDGKQEAVSAFAHAIGSDKPILLDPARLSPAKRLHEVREVLQFAAQSAQRKNRYEVIAIRGIDSLLPATTNRDPHSVRSEFLKALASSEFASDPRLVFVCLTTDADDGTPATRMDDATRSRMGVKLSIAAPSKERWLAVLPSMIWNIMHTAPTAVPLRRRWARPGDAGPMDDVIEQLAERGARERWDMGAVRARLRELQFRLSQPLYEASNKDAALLPAVQREFFEHLRRALSEQFDGRRFFDGRALADTRLQDERAKAEPSAQSQVEAMETVFKEELLQQDERLTQSLAGPSARVPAAGGLPPMTAAQLLEWRLQQRDFDAETDGDSGSGADN